MALRRRSAIAPKIGHMKTDGRLPRCGLNVREIIEPLAGRLS
jgi:hypothetical protein